MHWHGTAVLVRYRKLLPVKPDATPTSQAKNAKFEPFLALILESFVDGAADCFDNSQAYKLAIKRCLF